MPRGKNYVNHNRGVFLKASQKQKHARQSQSMEMCFYGAGCTRRDCFYRHPDGTSPGAGGSISGEGQSQVKRSAEPCMAYLAGVCTFSSGGCRNRHPPTDEECERLIARYRKMRCRYGEQCRTNHCLYLHPGDDGDDDGALAPGGAAAVAPSLGPGFVAPPPQSAWRPEMPGVATAAAQSPHNSAWRPEPHPAAGAGAGAGGPPPQSVEASSAVHPYNPSAWGGHRPEQPPPPQAVGVGAATTTAYGGGNGDGMDDSGSPAAPQDAPGALNVNAREFVPGWG